MKRLVSLILSAVLLISFGSYAAAEKNDELPVIGVRDVVARCGETFEVPVYISANPGIIALRITAEYDESLLTLISVSDSGLFDGANSLFSNRLSSPFVMLWENGLAVKNYTDSGTLAVLKFRINDGVTADSTTVSVSYSQGSTFDAELNETSFETKNGTVYFDRLAVAPYSASVGVGESVQLSALYGRSGNAAGQVVWNVSDPLVASVDSNGNVTGRRQGNVRITATDKNGNIAESFVQVRSSQTSVKIFSYDGKFEKKVNWWKPYSSAKIQLGFEAYNLSGAAQYRWESDSSRVKVDQSGTVTNKSALKRTATITLKVFDSNGTVIASDSVKVKFYKF